MAKLEEEEFTNCSAHFCLTVALYMWCDNIDPGCVGRCMGVREDVSGTGVTLLAW